MTVQTFASAADVMARLRLPAGHPDAVYVADVTAEANELVSTWLGIGAEQPELAPVPAGVKNAAVGIGARLYRWKDVASDVADTWGDLGPQPSTPRDPLAGYYDRLAPYRPGSLWAPAPAAYPAEAAP